MKTEKPSIPQGTRDFGPDKMFRRQFIFNTIRQVFEKYGYPPLETPAMENLHILTGKYGMEGDQLLYKVLNSGDFLSKTTIQDFEKGYKHLTPLIAGKGLRYDLTVPFARYVVMNQHNISFPFKRYQIQPVWRADRPQKGRYREFYQCDADVVGTDSLLCEAEFIMMIGEVFKNLGLHDFTIKINDRKLLTAITEWIGESGKETAFCTAIDKLDKIGRQKVEEELEREGFSAESIKMLHPIFDIEGTNEEKINQLSSLLKDSETGQKGIDELRETFRYLHNLDSHEKNIIIDLTLARGLTYYTGIILEVRANNSSIKSSIGGGGRYDNLTGVFGLEGISGVGFSFGVDRIYDVMEDLGLFPENTEAAAKAFIVHFDDISFKESLRVVSALRKSGIKSEVYPDRVKIKKQMSYANKKGVPFVILIGDDEVKSGKYQLKNMKTGEQLKLELDELIEFLT